MVPHPHVDLRFFMQDTVNVDDISKLLWQGVDEYDAMFQSMYPSKIQPPAINQSNSHLFY